MLTPEQIKSLKPGQELCCNCSFVETKDYGNRIVVDMCYAGDKERTTSRISYFYEQLSLPPAPHKYDPCRFLRKGDRVKIKREINGRILNHVFCNFSYDKIYTVHEDEKQRDSRSGLVTITNGKQTCMLSFYELELVTPVEEREPYSVD